MNEQARSPRRRQPLTVRGILEVLGLLAVVGVVGWFACDFVGKKRLEARVQAALPKLTEAIRTQRHLLLSAIEAYKQTYHRYPPDHLLSTNPPVVDVVTNPLLYELAGTVYEPATRTYHSATLPPLTAQDVRTVFNLDGFVNAAASTSTVKRLFPPLGRYVVGVREAPDVSVLGFAPMPYEFPPDLLDYVDVSPWRYLSSQPTRNPGTFDLWIEVKAGRRKLVIGNWKEAE